MNNRHMANNRRMVNKKCRANNRRMAKQEVNLHTEEEEKRHMAPAGLAFVDCASRTVQMDDTMRHTFLLVKN